MIQTDRLILRAFREEDRQPFAAINGDPRVNEWLGGPISAEQSDALVDRINAQIRDDGFGFFAAERKTDGRLIGMIGIRAQKDAPPAPCLELGWRLEFDAQGQGFASEGAKALLDWGFATQGADEILAWTAHSNLPSQAVMRRIGMAHDPARDFDHPVLAEDHPLRRHVVFVAKRPA
jgi:RimJ/RimL family protein N-acetyltransferase